MIFMILLILNRSMKFIEWNGQHIRHRKKLLTIPVFIIHAHVFRSNCIQYLHIGNKILINLRDQKDKHVYYI